MFGLYDVVKLKKDDQVHGVKAAYIGAIVDVLSDSKGDAYTIEFIDEKGETIEEALFAEYTPDSLTLVEHYSE